MGYFWVVLVSSVLKSSRLLSVSNYAEDYTAAFQRKAEEVWYPDKGRIL